MKSAAARQEAKMSGLCQVVADDLRDYIKKLKYYLSVDEAALAEGNSWNEDIKMMKRSSIRWQKKNIANLESIIEGRGWDE